MPTEKPRFSITIDEKLEEAIENYKYRSGAKNKTQAVVQLVELGIDSLMNDRANKKTPEPESSEDDKISIDEIKLFLRRFGYIDGGRELTEKDVQFIGGIFDLLDAWFG